MNMRSEFLVALSGAILLSAVLAAQQPQQQQPPPPPPKLEEPQQRPLFRGGARFVRVDVYPTDRDGRPVEGLKQEDFEIYEDGKPQQVDTFEFVHIVPEVEDARVDPNTQREGEEQAKDPRARVFVVVLDTWHVEVLGGAMIRTPLISMLDRLIGPRDLFGVLTPQLRATDLILGRKTLTVADMLWRHWTWGTQGSITVRDDFQEFAEDCAANQIFDPRLTGEVLARKRERDTFEHLDALVDKLASIRDEKKAIVIVTQGWQQFTPNEAAAKRMAANAIPGIYVGGGRIGMGDPRPTGVRAPDAATCQAQANALLMMDNRRFFIDVFRKAQRANVSFYPVDPRGLAVWDNAPATRRGGGGSVSDNFDRLRSKRDGLQELADNTDGAALIFSNDLNTTLSKFADSLSKYYLLGYYSTNTKFDGGYRRLEVKVRKPDIKLKARRGYFAPTQEEIDSIAAGRAAASRPVPAETMALSKALGRLEELRHDRDLFVQAARAGDSLVIAAELGVTARQAAAWANGGEVRLVVSTGNGEITETRTIEPMRSGVLVRVPLSDSGDVRIEARARSAAGGAADTTFTLGPAGQVLIGEVLSHRGLARALMPAADGRYRRTERATIEAPLGAGAIAAGARVLDRLGKPLNIPVSSRERIDPQGVRWITAEVVLAPLSEGDYVIEIEATRDAVRERKLFAIRVVR
jgi:VWFA-related protein